MPDSTCPTLLWNIFKKASHISHTGLSPSSVRLPNLFCYMLRLSRLPYKATNMSTTPYRQRVRALTSIWFGLFPFRSPLLRESLLISFPRVTKMFQFTRFASSHDDDTDSSVSGFPIRESTDQRSLATPRRLSQLATPFIASHCQGIHHMPFIPSLLVYAAFNDLGGDRGTRTLDPLLAKQVLSH